MPANPLAASSASPSLSSDESVTRARAFALPLLAAVTLPSGEPALVHADGVAAIISTLGSAPALQSAAYLVLCCDHLSDPRAALGRVADTSVVELALSTHRLLDLQRHARTSAARTKSPARVGEADQTEIVRKMLLAFAKDMRVILLRLASRLQTLRHHAADKTEPEAGTARESLEVFAALANRLGIWQLKWELEDLSLRFLEPDTYREVAGLLNVKRGERERYIESLRRGLEGALRAQGILAEVQGRPKHIYSIVKKMRQKKLPFEQVFDVRALRVVVETVDECYAVLAHVHSVFTPLPQEFDDYIAKPKANGYQSLHTVVSTAEGKAMEIQIRTRAMHESAEHGVAAHWVYKEAGVKGFAGVSATSSYDAKIAVLRQLLAWQRDISDPTPDKGLLDDRIYVFTPDAAVIELPRGATPVDYAYALHTSLGHRCRGAKVDGAMVPLNTPLQNGQTVEITAARDSAVTVHGPSRDWLNPGLGYIVGSRARAKVRAWFNAQAQHVTVERGREAVEKLLQREGRTALSHDALAEQLGFGGAVELFEAVGKDECSLRAIELHLRPNAPDESPADAIVLRAQQNERPGTAMPSKGNVLVVGVDSLMTQLARCCKPAPPDAIVGFVSRGHGVRIHRANCSHLRDMARKDAERLIEVAWGSGKPDEAVRYAVDVVIEAQERDGLLRDVAEAFARDKLLLSGMRQQVGKDRLRVSATVHVPDAGRLSRALAAVMELRGVHSARRR